MNDNIVDHSAYCNRLYQSVADKLFWIDKIEADVVIDYGCADGSQIMLAKSLLPDCEFIGYDNDIIMQEKAAAHSISATSTWSDIAEKCVNWHTQGRKICLLVSSVMHEVYSYDPGFVPEFQQQIWGVADTVVFRDMMASRAAQRPSDPCMTARIRQLHSRRQLDEWEKLWGSIDNNLSLLHFLLTYSYAENWQRELKENYFPVMLEQFLLSIPNHYKPIYFDHSRLPYLARKVRRDFGIDIPDPTHLKMILELQP